MLQKIIAKLPNYSTNWSEKELNQTLERYKDEYKKSFLQNYYHPSIGRDQAEKLLLEYYNKYDNYDGCFLIRPCTSSKDDFSLSAVHQGRCHHYKISHALDAYYAIGDGPLIHGLDQLIDNYQAKQHGLPFPLAKVFVPGELLPGYTRIGGISNPLHKAAAEVAEIDKLKYILKSPHCPDINERDEDGRTALDIACEYDNLSAIKEIMKKSPLTNIKAADDYTPLHRAAEHNATHAIDFLLLNKLADPTERLVEDNYVPLHVAAKWDKFMCVKMLLKHDVPDKPRTSDNKTPLDIAIENDCKESIAILSRHEPKKPKTRSSEWLHEGCLTRELAKKILLNAKIEFGDGVFLVRRSSNGTFALSLMTSSDFFNYEICIKEGEKYFYIDDGPYFRTLEMLIEHHRCYEDGLPVKLSYPIAQNSTHSQMIMNNIPQVIQTRPSIQQPIVAEPVIKSDLPRHIESSRQVVRNKRKNNSSKLATINESDIKYEAVIGEGEFGIVYKGTLKGKKVAIKVLKDCQATNDFKREAEIMQKLGNHPCILNIYGMIVENNKFMMVQELMIGSILDKLLEKPRVVTEYHLRSWAVEIVSGMEHMESKKIVHRDLAARNILLGSHFQAKISDFGLSRAFEGDEYTQTTDSKIPIKWYAPESIEKCRFTSKSDTWSFGVTLWEMWTYGDVPYGDMNGSQVYDFIQKGKRLEQPNTCPKNTYELMIKCWEWDEDKRPSFKEMKDLISKDKDYEEMKSIYFDSGQS